MCSVTIRTKSRTLFPYTTLFRSINNRIRRVAPPLPGFSGGDTAIASEDGGWLYQFDAAGRHLRTLDALTGAAIYEFTHRSEEHTSELQSPCNLLCRLLLEKK